VTRPISLDELASEPLVHHYGDYFAPPGLTNWLGVAQMDNDLVAVRAISFPPYSMGDATTARAYIGGRLANSYGGPVTFTWRADRVVREAQLGDLRVRTTTVMVPGRMALAIDIAVTNDTDQQVDVPVEIVFGSHLTHALRPWDNALNPAEYDNVAEQVAEFTAIRFTAQHSPAVTVHGIDREGTATASRVSTQLTIPAGATDRVGVVIAVGADAVEASATFAAVAADVPRAISDSETVWQAEIDAMFVPGNDKHGGSLPVLETSNEALRRIYYMGAVGVLYMRRDSPASVIGRTYDTLMPRYWAGVTFLWDYYLSTRVHALLEPDVMRHHLEHWIANDAHTGYGTEWLTGKTFGAWYSVNDLALTRMIHDYVAWNGAEDWLEKPVDADTSAKPVLDHLEHFATNFRSKLQPHGLADYGGIDNLLECVSSYIHAVPSFNAGNVWCLRALAAIFEQRGDKARATDLRDEATALAAKVNELYVEGGYWNVRHPDGREVPVKHCLDFFHTVFAMAAEMPPKQRDEMVAFFVDELQTPLWMHALAPSDPDAVFSVRPDHQWNGAYPAWPPESARALFMLGRDDIAAPWLQGLAASLNQGPPGQAHFAEDAMPPDGRGARKATAEVPWINDWATSSSGAWTGMVIDGVFGVSVAPGGEVSATPRLALVDPDARLRDLVIRGQRYDVDAAGAHPAASG
jgi:hypothetical protein